MRIGFNTGYCNAFTKNISHCGASKIQTQSKEEAVEDTIEITIEDRKNKTGELHRNPITRNAVNKFVQFYYGLPEESRESIYYCLMDDEERYCAILDRIDKIEGKDRHTKPKKSLTERFLELMMLPDVISDNARYDAEELTQLPAFNNGKNENVHRILIELSNPIESEEETQAEEIAETDTFEGIQDTEEDDYILADDSFYETEGEEKIKPAKIGFLKKAAAFFAAAK